MLLNSIPKGAHAPLGVRDALAVGIWAAGFGLEIVADRRELLLLHYSSHKDRSKMMARGRGKSMADEDDRKERLAPGEE